MIYKFLSPITIAKIIKKMIISANNDGNNVTECHKPPILTGCGVIGGGSISLISFACHFDRIEAEWRPELAKAFTTGE